MRICHLISRALWLPALFLAALPLFPQSSAAPLEITGAVRSGSTPLPGVAITVTNTATGQSVLTSTDVDGSYSVAVASAGRYSVKTQLAGFAAASKEVTISGATRIDLEMTLESRVARVASPPAMARAAGNTRGFQNLSLVAQMAGVPESEIGAENQGAQNGSDVPTESVTVSGNSGASEFQTLNPEQIQRRMDEMGLGPGQFMAQAGGPGGPGGPGGGGPGSGFPGGGPGARGGMGPGPGGFGGRGGMGGPMIGRVRFNINRPHGSFFYSLGDAAFDASPYALNGRVPDKAGYTQSRYGATIGGPLNIPHIYKGGTKTFFFVNYTGSRASNPYDAFSTVPTLLEREGDFSQALIRSGPQAGMPVQIVDPVTQQVFAGDKLPAIDPAAAALLNFIPEPNLPGDTQNFHYVTSALMHNDSINVRMIHNFGAGGFGGRRGQGGGGGRGRRNANNINFGFRYSHTNSAITNPFPGLGGNTQVTGIEVPIGYTRSIGRLTNSARFDFNRNRIDTQNLFALTQNVAGAAGVTGVSQNPLDWGVPGLSFTNFSGVTNTNPLLRRDQTVTLSDNLIWTHGRHSLRWGGDFRRIQLNPLTSSNARGSFVFTGAFSGYDFADFLLGLPAQASVQYGQNAYYFRGNSWDAYVQDNWQVRAGLTLNLGVRYEYVSPFSEKYGHIVNLDVAPGFTAVAPVVAGAVGPYTGQFTSSLVNPDRNNFAPRLGVAWKAFKNTVVRAGYGINYNTGAYANIVQQLAFQPPFSFTATNVASATLPLTLENAFPTLAPGTTTNNYGVNRDYRLGYVQIWNTDIQQDLGHGVLMNVSYTGTKGTALDMVRAPNRGPDGLLLPNVQAFLWESSEGSSVMHSGSVRVRKRMQHGLLLGGTYVYSKSIDNASSIGGGATVVAQNDADLAAERGLSSFDQRHRFIADYVYEFPIGTNKRFLGTGRGLAAHLLGDWQWSGNITIASGTPFTARVLGAATDISAGLNGTLRADVTGTPLSLADPTTAEWFNTAAFILPCQVSAAGQCIPGTIHFGDAGRNTIIGPSMVDFDMAMSKTVSFGDNKSWEVRVQATNVFNTPHFTAIDTTVNSPTFGAVRSVGAMRQLQIVTRFRF